LYVELKMNKFQAGDIFTFELPSNEYIFGRIMLDIKEQCIRPKLIKHDSALSFFNGSILVEIYKSTAVKTIADLSEILIPGIFIDTDYLEAGYWNIVNHKDVNPQEVEFPEYLVGSGLRAKFIRGEISLNLDLRESDVERVNVYGTKKSSATLGEICLYHLGRSHEINNPRLKNIELRSLKNSDLRFSQHRSEIYGFLGEDPNQSYDKMSTKFGYDIQRFYINKK
jgi:hypothetical protein